MVSTIRLCRRADGISGAEMYVTPHLSKDGGEIMNKGPTKACFCLPPRLIKGQCGTCELGGRHMQLIIPESRCKGKDGCMLEYTFKCKRKKEVL